MNLSLASASCTTDFICSFHFKSPYVFAQICYCYSHVLFETVAACQSANSGAANAGSATSAGCAAGCTRLPAVYDKHSSCSFHCVYTLPLCNKCIEIVTLLVVTRMRFIRSSAELLVDGIAMLEQLLTSLVE